MLINNLELIAPLVSSYNPELFYHMQIVCRAKDHKDEKVREGAIKTYGNDIVWWTIKWLN